jgi:hypothetical protein
MPVERVDLNITARTQGMAQIKSLEAQLRGLRAEVQNIDILTRKTHLTQEISIAKLQKQSAVTRIQIADKQRLNAHMVQEQIRNEALNATYERNIAELREKTFVQMMANRGSMSAAEASGLELMAEQRANAERQKSIELLRVKQRQILASTMSIFGMTMSIWQVTNALTALAGENEELKKDMKMVQALTMGATGPLLLFHGILQLTTMEVTRLGRAMLVMLPASLAIASAYIALTSHSKELRIAAGALAGALTALTLVKIKSAIASYLQATATNVATGATIAQMAVSSLGTLLPVIAGAIIGAIAVSTTLPEASAQTEPGQFRRIRRDAVIQAHQDEVVTTPMEAFGTRGGGGQDIVVIIDGRQVERVTSKETQRNTYAGWA